MTILNTGHGMSFPPTTPTTRFLKLELLWLVLGLTAALIPLILIWYYLGSGFAGGDGKLYQTIVDTYLRFGRWGDVIIHDPLEGAWNIGLPMVNPWLNPALVPFSFLTPDRAKVWTAAICYISYALSWYLVLRSVGVPALRSVVIAQLTFVIFDPFYRVFGWPANAALAPWNSIVFALAFVVASLLLRVDDFRGRTIITNGVAVAVIVMVSIALDPLWTLLAYSMLVIPFAITACERGFKAITAARWLVLLFALGLVFALGPLQFLLAMTTDTSRYVETRLNVYPQVPELVSTIFEYPQAKQVFAALIIGWVLGVAFGRGRTRFLPLVAIAAFATECIFSAFFLLADVRWILPLPRYYQFVFTGWYVLGAGVGYAVPLSAALKLISMYWPAQFAFKSRLLPAARVLGSLVCLSLVPSYLADTWANVDSLKGLMERWPTDDEMVGFIAKPLSLVPDSAFPRIGSDHAGRLRRLAHPGYSVESPYSHSQRIFRYCDRAILCHASRAPDKGQRCACVKSVAAVCSAYAGMGKVVCESDRSAWRRFILSREPLDFSAAFPNGMGNLKEVQFRVTSPPATWYVYELPLTNTGNYSPTVVYKLAMAPEMLDKMESPEFDFRTDAVVTEDVSETLVPLKDMKLSFERNAARVQGTSDGTSLALLPLQYSHCLRLSDPNARLVRADLALVGVVFRVNLDAKITDDFGMFAPGCRALDGADVRRLKIAIQHFDFPPDVGMRPTAVRSAADLLPNVMKILQQVQ